MLPWLWAPNSASSARSELASSWGNLASIVSTALPGITRGMAKFTVIANHAATK